MARHKNTMYFFSSRNLEWLTFIREQGVGTERQHSAYNFGPAAARMDLLEDLGFALDLEECDISEEGAAASPESTDVLAASRRFQSGRSAAQHAYGDGKWRVGAGPMRLDWRCCVEHMLSTASLAEREECVRALGTLAQVCRGACMVLVHAWRMHSACMAHAGGFARRCDARGGCGGRRHVAAQ